jgi:hypothetical protein
MHVCVCVCVRMHIHLHIHIRNPPPPPLTTCPEAPSSFPPGRPPSLRPLALPPRDVVGGGAATAACAAAASAAVSRFAGSAGARGGAWQRRAKSPVALTISNARTNSRRTRLTDASVSERATLSCRSNGSSMHIWGRCLCLNCVLSAGFSSPSRMQMQ